MVALVSPKTYLKANPGALRRVGKEMGLRSLSVGMGNSDFKKHRNEDARDVEMPIARLVAARQGSSSVDARVEKSFIYTPLRDGCYQR